MKRADIEKAIAEGDILMLERPWGAPQPVRPLLTRQQRMVADGGRSFGHHPVNDGVLVQPLTEHLEVDPEAEPYVTGPMYLKMTWESWRLTEVARKEEQRESERDREQAKQRAERLALALGGKPHFHVPHRRATVGFYTGIELTFAQAETLVARLEGK